MRKISKIHKNIHRQLNKAVYDFNMIADGDRIAVGLSGGKDSMTLLLMLSERLKSVQNKYELFPIYIDPGFKNSFGHEIDDYCSKNGYNFTWEISDHGVIAHSTENRENPCFLCSRLRRKRLFEIADKFNCKKLALGHNKDDLIETLFINMFYSGRIATMIPNQPVFNNSFQIIRPLALVDENDIIKFSNEQNFPVFQNPCPSAGKSKRKEIKDFLKNLYEVNNNIKGNIFSSMSHVNPEYLLT